MTNANSKPEMTAQVVFFHGAEARRLFNGMFAARFAHVVLDGEAVGGDEAVEALRIAAIVPGVEVVEPADVLRTVYRLMPDVSK